MYLEKSTPYLLIGDKEIDDLLVSETDKSSISLSHQRVRENFLNICPWTVHLLRILRRKGYVPIISIRKTKNDASNMK